MQKKKSLYIVMIIGLSAVALALAGVLGVSLVRHRSEEKPAPKGDTAEYELVTDTAYENQFDTIDISSDCGNIFVLTSEDAQLHLKIWADEEKVSITEMGTRLNITADARDSQIIGIDTGVQQVRVELYLPADFDKQLELKTDYGNFEVEQFPSLLLKAESDYGSLSLDEAASLEAKLEYGSVRAGRINTLMIAESEMGNIDIEELAVTEDSSIACEMGNIHIDSAPTVIVEASTNLGAVDVRSDPADATVKLTLENDNGSITVE